jgi:hypothetical protein
VVKLLDPLLNDLSPRHLEIYWRYQVVRTAVDFGAAICFVIGSAFFFFASLTTEADWLFLVGSLLFAVKPTIDMVRSGHLRRLPADRDSGLPSRHPRAVTTGA